MSDEILTQLWKAGPMMVEGTPHARLLGIKFVAVDIGKATLSLPYNEKLIGDRDTKIMHGGVITSLLDQASGLAAMAGLSPPRVVATLDLRIDYMRGAEPGKTVIAQAECYKAGSQIAFVRAFAHDGDIDDPVATSQATFMVTASKLPAKTAEAEGGQ